MVFVTATSVAPFVIYHAIYSTQRPEACGVVAFLSFAIYNIAVVCEIVTRREN